MNFGEDGRKERERVIEIGIHAAYLTDGKQKKLKIREMFSKGYSLVRDTDGIDTFEEKILLLDDQSIKSDRTRFLHTFEAELEVDW